MGRNPSPAQSPRPAWLAALVAFFYAIVAVAPHLPRYHIHMSWWGMVPITVVGWLVTFVVTVIQSNNHGNAPGWGRVYVYRSLVWLFLGAWGLYITVWGLAGLPILTGVLLLAGLLVALTVILGAIGNACAPPPPPDTAQQDLLAAQAANRSRDPRALSWEQSLHEVTVWKETHVLGVRSWENAEDGETVFVRLPGTKGHTADDLGGFALKIAVNRGLPKGCAVSVTEGDHQNIAKMDVMLRNTLADEQPPHFEPTSEASINDSFPAVYTAQRKAIFMCLRLLCMLVGGATGSGKTTFLHRIIMFLARCSDTLICIGDTSGGGLGEPWTRAWRERRADCPTPFWVATSPEEVAGMTAWIVAVLRDRKTDPAVVAAMRKAGKFVLPVSKHLPGYEAIICIIDEGGDMNTDPGPFAQAAVAHICTIGDLGRAMAARVVLSALRSTSDMLSKRFRVQAALRACFRCTEAEEYYHILETTPKTKLGATIGLGFWRDSEHVVPELMRARDITPETIDHHSIATARLRPQAGDRAMRVGGRVTPQMILGRNHVTAEQMSVPVMRDAARGELVTGRWQRYLDALHEHTLVDDDMDTAPAASTAPVAVEQPVVASDDALEDQHAGIADLLRNHVGTADIPVQATNGGAGARIYAFPNGGHHAPVAAPPRPAVPAQADSTAHERMLSELELAGPGGVGANELARRMGGSRGRAFELMGKARAAKEIGANADDKVVLIRYAVTKAPSAG